MLEEAGIAVLALRDHGQVLICLKRDHSGYPGKDKIAEMEISLSGIYRYEHPGYGFQGSGVFGKWPKDDFVVFLYQKLFEDVSDQ